MRSAGTSSGAYAVDLESGLELARDPARRPADARLGGEALHDVDGAAALRPGGPARHHRARAAAVDPGGVLAGDLYLRGGGDPTFGPGQAGALAATLVRQTGLRAVDGPRDRRRVGVRHPARPAVVGLRDLALRRAAERADLQPRAHGRQAAGLPGPPRALRRRGLPARARARGGRRRGGRRRRRHPAGRRHARRAALPADGRARAPDQRAVGQLRWPRRCSRRSARGYGGAGSTRAGAQVVRSAAGRPRPRPDGRRRLGALARQPHQPAPGGAAAPAHGRARTPSRPSSARWRSPGVSGTLRRRMRGTPAQRRCRGKTGTLTGVSALAGYCTTTSGSRVAFAFLMNRVSATGARAPAGPHDRRARPLPARRGRRRPRDR